MNRKPSDKELAQRIDESQNTVASLKESVVKYQRILDEIEDAYLETDLEGNPILFNRAFCEIFGYPPDQPEKVDIFAHTDKETTKAFRKAYNTVYKTQKPLRGFIHEITRKDGTRRVLENYVSLKKDTDGTANGFRTVLRDVTERRHAEKELAKHRQRLEAIFSSVKDAIITVDPDMKVVEANKAAETICGMKLNEMVGRVFVDSLNQCERACYDVLRQPLIEEASIQEYRVECRHQHRPHQVVDVTVSPLLSQDDKSMGAVLVIRDVTRLSDLERELNQRRHFHGIIGKSAKMQDIYSLLEDLTDVETTVLITGESGTGKEIVANALHYSGNRKDKSMVKVNCSALAENLLESELFGHVKGAFTGAIRDKQGRFQMAHEGTILLDEIGDISPRIQLRLLRVLEEKEFERVGESVPVKFDVRVIACTNQDLKEKVRTGEFREDLYYRLKVIELVLPPLRERLEDIPLLVAHFCSAFNKKFQKNIEGVSDTVLRCLMNYPWPGNVRELEHTIERAFVLCREKTIRLKHIPLDMKDYTETKKTFPQKKPALGSQEILEVLNKTDWNKAKAARLLGIHRRTIYRKIAEYNLSKPNDYVA